MCLNHKSCSSHTIKPPYEQEMYNNYGSQTIIAQHPTVIDNIGPFQYLSVKKEQGNDAVQCLKYKIIKKSE